MFSPRCRSILSSINECLAIDSGGKMNEWFSCSNCSMVEYSPTFQYLFLLNLELTRFNKIVIQASSYMAAGKEAFSRVHMYYSKCNLPLQFKILVYFVLEHIDTNSMHIIYTIICLKSVAVRNSCSIASGDISN